jgi:hypothetical protein
MYYPSRDELDRLDELQRQLSYWRAELAREWQLKRFTPGERYLSKERFHNGFRNRWTIFPGFKIKLLENLN